MLGYNHSLVIVITKEYYHDKSILNIHCLPLKDLPTYNN